ncbi:hypothetical protein N9Z27_00810 [Alphaproteobacteria bacterium]|nr:hypothetical protein [Alphaproteobacteria bacterium]
MSKHTNAREIKMINRRHIMLYLFLCTMLAGFFVLTTPQKASAAQCCNCPDRVEAESAKQWETGPTPAGDTKSWPTVQRLVTHSTSELAAQRIWMISVFWEDNVLPAMMLMSEQLTAVAIKQAQIIGSFIDAKHQMETQQVLQKMRAQAHKDYQPSVGMCEFGTGIKSLAASERRAEYNAYLLSQRAQDRHLGNAFTSARTGVDSDRENRIEQFKSTYCDTADNNNGLSLLCDGGSAEPIRRNRDIDFARVVGFPLTLEVDFTNTDKSDDEEDILALSSNLYGHEVFSRPGAKSLKGEEDKKGVLSEMQKHYMDARSIIAKRSVAENSFNAITAMKSEGTEGSEKFLKAILSELGISDDEADAQLSDNVTPADHLLGDKPSYFAQMEVLGKKIYQNPDFYTNLYDKPANVERKKVAMQAIGLMQKFDLFKSYLRHEASMSVLLELAVIDLQDEVENEINTAQAEGRQAESN